MYLVPIKTPQFLSFESYHTISKTLLKNPRSKYGLIFTSQFLICNYIHNIYIYYDDSIQYFAMRQNRKSWSHEQDAAIVNLVKKYGTKRWTLISEKMKERFPQDGRSGKQCRERWHNHLSPIINKQPWSEQEIKIVFDSHRKFGNRWTQIAQLLEGRTDNAVKNQFYSTLRKGLRRICKILGTRNSTSRVKKIKPTALSTLISNITQIPVSQGENQQELYDMLFEFSTGDKYDELKQKTVSEKYREKMERLLEKILDSKDFHARKRNRTKIQKQTTQQRGQIQKSLPQQVKLQPIKTTEKNLDNIQVAQEDPPKFEFNLVFESEGEDNENYFQFSRSPNFIRTQSQIISDDVSFRFDKPISLKKQNSQLDSMKDENMISWKKKSSENEKVKKLSQFEIENSQNMFKGFLSKSPNYTSKFKMPTPRIQQGSHTFTFIGYGDDYIGKNEQPEKQLNDYYEELKTKIGSRIR